MISLTPIDERIQKRLFQKMELLGNKREIPNVSAEERISPQQIYNKTTFIRMSSVLTNPVVLMGGELKDDGTMYGGYDDIYGKRGDSENKFKRPIPGVKSIDVEFKGGQKALREATISWTCWSFEDITRLTPHFLTPGTQVLLEWGWVYDENTLKKLPTLKDLIGDNDIKDTVYQNYQDIVLQNNGDFDFTVGIVKNYEYTTREDGAFDCQTTISSIGTSIFSTPQPNKQTENTSLILQRRQLRKISSDRSTTDDILTFDVGVTFKFFMKNFRDYVYQDIFNFKDGESSERYKYTASDGIKTVKPGIEEIPIRSADEADRYFVRKNAYIYKRVKGSTNKSQLSAPIWVRFGWFEDNILSKFISLVQTNRDKDPLVFHRSVEKVIRDGKTEFESVRIRNHKYLETVNTSRYILPGKLKAFEPKNRQTSNIERQEATDNFNKLLGKTSSGNPLIGDSPDIVQLAKIVNDKDLFSQFDTDKEDEGYLRNILISYDVLKRCFSNVTDSSESGTESLNFEESFSNLFRELNSDISIWNFETTADEEDIRRTKIIDTSITAVDFDKINKVDSVNENKNGTKSVYNPTTNEVTNNGVFFFPVWKTNSIVKSQNVTVTIPDSLKLTTMYGNTYQPEKTNNNPEPEFTDLPVLILGSLTIDELEKRKDLSIALRADLYDLFGAKEQDELDGFIGPLKSKGGNDSVIKFISNNTEQLKENYKDKLNKLNDQINSGLSPNSSVVTNLDPSISYPTPDFFYKEYPDDFIEVYTNDEIDYHKIYSQKFNENGRMKEQFIDFISDLISLTESGTASPSKQTQIIPFDLELDIDGIGGILPFNSFHSSYLPKKYQEKTIFQIFDVGHKVDSSGWTVSLSGKMRTTLDKATLNKSSKNSKDIVSKAIEGILGRKGFELQDEIQNIGKGSGLDKTTVNTGVSEKFTINIPLPSEFTVSDK